MALVNRKLADQGLGALGCRVKGFRVALVFNIQGSGFRVLGTASSSL